MCELGRSSTSCALLRASYMLRRMSPGESLISVTMDELSPEMWPNELADMTATRLRGSTWRLFSWGLLIAILRRPTRGTTRPAPLWERCLLQGVWVDVAVS